MKSVELYMLKNFLTKVNIQQSIATLIKGRALSKITKLLFCLSLSSIRVVSWLVRKPRRRYLGEYSLLSFLIIHPNIIFKRATLLRSNECQPLSAPHRGGKNIASAKLNSDQEVLCLTSTPSSICQCWLDYSFWQTCFSLLEYKL